MTELIFVDIAELIECLNETPVQYICEQCFGQLA